MFDVKMGVCGKPSTDLPEDFVGSSADFCWLLDGATPPVGELNHRHTRYFVEELDRALTMYSSVAEDPADLLFRALREVRDTFMENGLGKI